MKKSLVLFFAILWSTSVFAAEEKVIIIEGFNDYGLADILREHGPMVTADTALGFVNTIEGGFGVVLEEGRPELEVKISIINRYEDSERFVVDLKETGFADDSVKGQWKRFLFKQMKDSRLKLVSYGSKWQCYRGENKDKWIKGLCG